MDEGKISSIINGSKGKEIKINYEQLKIHMGYEDLFFNNYLMPFLQEKGFTHRFSGTDIILIKR